jgi:hypothetical protein
MYNFYFLFCFCSEFEDAGCGNARFWWVDVFLPRQIEFQHSVTLFRLQSQLCTGLACTIMAGAIVVCAIVVCATDADKAID